LFVFRAPLRKLSLSLCVFRAPSAIGVLNYFRNFKMAESCFSFYIKSPKQGNKTSPCCLDGWIIYSNGIGEYAGKPHVL
jgi:hypothetical protein